jgi:DNA polymerase elongation subunit (family B)
MNKDQIKAFLTNNPGYLKWGKKKLATKFNVSAKVIVQIKKDILGVTDKQFKRLFFDIETCPNIGFFWEAGYKLNVGPQNIIQERRVICVSYKWENEDVVYNLRWDDNKDDKSLLQAFAKIMYEADEVVSHNGDKFDIPWLRARCLYHRIAFPTYVKSLDTYVKSKAQFRFNSFKLDYIAKFLGVGGKIETGGWESWVKITLYNDKEALDTMIEYCNNDVIILEDVFKELESYIKLNTHVGVFEGKSKCSCPACGEDKTNYLKPWITNTGTVQRLMVCSSCGIDFKISNTAFKKK